MSHARQLLRKLLVGPVRLTPTGPQRLPTKSGGNGRGVPARDENLNISLTSKEDVADWPMSGTVAIISIA